MRWGNCVIAGILPGHSGIKTGAAYAMATTGFFGMSMNLSLIFKVQSQYGYIYQVIGILSALFMCGACAGSMASGYVLKKCRRVTLSILAALEAACAAFIFVVLIALTKATSDATNIYIYGILFVLSGFLWVQSFRLQLFCIALVEITAPRALELSSA